jgi:ubiquinone/menaquinone biosynthesis C-methylase UbiE
LSAEQKVTSDIPKATTEACGTGDQQVATSAQEGNTPVTPETLQQMSFSFVPSRVLCAGVQLGVFAHIADGNTTAQEIARVAEASERGMRMLLDALVACQLLSKMNGRYGLTPLAARYLVRGRPDYMGSMMEYDPLWEGWGHLTEVVRTGKPFHRVEERERAETFFPHLVRTLHITNREPARRAARVLGAGHPRRGLRVLDLACGSGVWGIAIAEADPEARVTAQDFPALLSLTREYVTRHGVAERYEFLPGDLKEVDFGENRYDLALLGNILHSEGERASRDVLRRLDRALRPGGRVAIIDMVPGNDRTGPPFPVLFALNMLLNTEEGDTYTLAEYTQWLQEAGFARVDTADIGSHSPLIIGCRD